MTSPRFRRLSIMLGVGLVLGTAFAVLLSRYSAEARAEVQRTVIGRDASVLQPVARHQIATAQGRAPAGSLRTADLLGAVLPSAQQEGMLAVAVFDAQGGLVRAVPGTLLFAELATTDYLALLSGGTISRFHPEFPLDRHFAGAATAAAPVLEVIIPLTGRGSIEPLGFAQYYVDARALQGELAQIEQRLHRQTLVAVFSGLALIAIVLGAAQYGLDRAQRIVAERNDKLARTNFELTLAAKASALGQITSHLIHGLQGSVAGLRAAVSTNAPNSEDWAAANRYSARIEGLVGEVITLLGEGRTGAVYELSGNELADIIRDRAITSAATKGINLIVDNQMMTALDNHRGSVVCLIAANLIQNAISVSDSGATVFARLSDQGKRVVLTVADEGPGVAPELQPRLFEPGASNRPGGSGLGLAISRLLARQVNGELELAESGPDGAMFRATIPRSA